MQIAKVDILFGWRSWIWRLIGAIVLVTLPAGWITAMALEGCGSWWYLLKEIFAEAVVLIIAGNGGEDPGYYVLDPKEHDL